MILEIRDHINNCIWKGYNLVYKIVPYRLPFDNASTIKYALYFKRKVDSDDDWVYVMGDQNIEILHDYINKQRVEDYKNWEFRQFHPEVIIE